MSTTVKGTLGVVGGLALAVGAFWLSWPLYLLKEHVTITVRMWEDKCVLVVPPERIRTQWDRPVTWTIAGRCPNHKVRVDGFVSINDGTLWVPIEEHKELESAEHDQRIQTKVKAKDPARRGNQKYGYLILIDGRPADGDPELRICPDWPC